MLLEEDGSAEVRREAAFSLGRLASDGEGVVDALRVSRTIIVNIWVPFFQECQQ